MSFDLFPCCFINFEKSVIGMRALDDGTTAVPGSGAAGVENFLYAPKGPNPPHLGSKLLGENDCPKTPSPTTQSYANRDFPTACE
jgi:hypothetical protein